ncbi:MAG: AraC family transcriptional regulator [Oscillospiraceae bacterium]|nr:AraC family transcriptional regulator [Oscillospiraceae bacterium]
MMEITVTSAIDSQGIAIPNCGGEQCAPGHTYGPAIRDHYLIHFVASGRGVLRTAEGEYHIGAGQGFIIFPDEITVYSADVEEPWSYDWVGYNGQGADELTAAAGLSIESRIFTADDPEAVMRILRDISDDMTNVSPLAAVGSLVRFLAKLGSRGGSAADIRIARRHYDRARWYMDGHYAQPITVQDVADFVGLSRSQLFRVFEACEGISPKEMLTSLRLRHACKLLTDTDMPLEEVAQQVGLASAQRLGVVFRERLGVSPGAYRQNIQK